MSERRREVAAVAALLLIVTLAFADMLFAGRNVFARDVSRYYYPMKHVVRELVFRGELPVWNPYLSGGQPLAANPEHEVWYPPQWLMFLPDYDFGFRLSTVFHYYLAAIGAYVFLRGLKLRRESAVFGGVVYSLGGLLVSLAILLPYLYCLAWLPWVLACVQRAIERRSVRATAAAALLLGIAVLAGEPMTLAQCLLMIGVFALWLGWKERLGRAISTLAAVYAGAVLVAVVQLVPGLDHFRDSVRVLGFPFELVSQWSAHPLRLVELAIPGFMGPPRTFWVTYWGTAKIGWLDPYLLSVYFGVLPLALVVAGMVARVRGWALTLALFAGGVLIALGSHTPLLRLLYDLRIFSSFRYPEKFLILATVPAIFFSAAVFDRLFDDGRLRRFALIASGVILGAATLLVIWSHTPDYERQFIAFWDVGLHPFARVMAALSVQTWWAAFASALGAVLVIAAAARVDRRIWFIAAISFIALELGLRRHGIAETIEPSFYRERPPLARDFGTRIFPQASWYIGTRTARRYFDLPEAAWMARNGLFPHTAALWSVPLVLNQDIDRTDLLPTHDLLEAMWRVANARRDWFEPFMAMSGARYRVMFVPFDEAVRRANGDLRRIQPVVLVPIAEAAPRYFVAREVVGIRDLDDFVARVSSGVSGTFVPGASWHPAPGDVRVVSERASDVSLDVNAAGDTLVVAAITRHKYWRATVDGRDAAIVPANIAYQAVRVPAGRHAVRFTYRNPLIVPCGLVSLAAVLALGAVIAFVRT